MTKFPVENIPNNDLLYCRVHVTNTYYVKDNQLVLKPQAFDPTPYDTLDGLSTNWSKYSDLAQTKHSAKKPQDNGVVSFIVQQVREIPLEVIHDPTNNRAHSLICGLPPRKSNDAKMTMKLRDICKWEILPDKYSK
jgi:hypothetical protein